MSNITPSFFHHTVSGKSIPVYLTNMEGKEWSSYSPISHSNLNGNRPEDEEILTHYGVSDVQGTFITCSQSFWDQLTSEERRVCLLHEEGHIELDHLGKNPHDFTPSEREGWELQADAYAAKYHHKVMEITRCVALRLFARIAQINDVEEDIVIAYFRHEQPKRCELLGL